MVRKPDKPPVWGDIPPILSSKAILDKGFKRAARVETRGKTRAERQKHLSVAKVQALGDSIASTLERYVKSFPSIENLPPFFRDLVDILVDMDKIKKDLGGIDWCRHKVLEFSKVYAREIGRQIDPAIIDLRRKEAYGRISSLVNQVSENLERLEDSRRKLSKTPTLDLEAPTVVVAGMANVGKSQFVAAVSSARPKIAHYPFTTKAVSVGHTERHGTRFQVIDTPGLLDRPADERNAIEQQAANALRNLARAVVFLLDPTETCGFTMESQLNLLKRLKEEFPEVLFVEVENKLDILDSKSGRRKVSALTGQGVEKTMDDVAAIITGRVPGASRPRRAG